MSGGVDSSVAAAILAESGHDVVGATLKLWGGASDSGCCSVADVDDARRVAGQLGHRPPRLQFHRRLRGLGRRPRTSPTTPRAVPPTPASSATGTIKFGLLLERARRLGFDALATGHHARVVTGRRRRRAGRPAPAARCRPEEGPVLRAVDAERAELGRVVLPVGELTKAEVRAHAARARAAHRRQARQPGRVLHPLRARAGAGFLAERMRCTPRSSSTRRAARWSARFRPASS